MTGIKLSAAIMAHPDRAASVRELQACLGPDIEIEWDARGDRWETGARAMLAHPAEATHHLVVQDDVVVPSGLLEAARAAVNAKPHVPISLYLGHLDHNDPIIASLVARAKTQDASWISFPELCSGQAVILPVDLIPEIVQTTLPVAGYDAKISAFLVSQNIPVLYTVPSLVDHREGPSLLGHPPTGRTAHYFVGAGAGASVFTSSTLSGANRIYTACRMCGAAGYGCSV